MSPLTLFSVIESSAHPDFSSLYRKKTIEEVRLHSIRKAISALNKQRPDYIVAEFFYGYANNYAGVNISNLDVLLSSLQKYAPAARVIVLVEKNERQYVDKLNELFGLFAILQYPVRESEMEALLK